MTHACTVDCTALDYYQDTRQDGRSSREVQYSSSHVKSDVTWAVAISPPTTSTTYPCTVGIVVSKRKALFRSQI
jgi:hypothetical protein